MKKTYKFEFNIEFMTQEAAEKFWDIILIIVEAIGLKLWGGFEEEKELTEEEADKLANQL